MTRSERGPKPSRSSKSTTTTALGVLLCAASFGSGCRSPTTRSPAVSRVAAEDVAPSAAPVVNPVDETAAQAPEQQAATEAATETATETVTETETATETETETVTVKLQVEPPRVAHVFWGARDLGPAPLEVKRPRGSGPLDLILRAPGYLPFHTRAFTDKDDHLAVRLVPEAGAASQFGYPARLKPKVGVGLDSGRPAPQSPSTLLRRPLELP